MAAFIIAGCGKSINEQIESNSQPVWAYRSQLDCCGKSINEQIESNSQPGQLISSNLRGCGKSINEQIESNSQHSFLNFIRDIAVAKVSMNKLKAIHNIVPSSTH